MTPMEQALVGACIPSSCIVGHEGTIVFSRNSVFSIASSWSATIAAMPALNLPQMGSLASLACGHVSKATGGHLDGCKEPQRAKASHHPHHHYRGMPRPEPAAKTGARYSPRAEEQRQKEEKHTLALHTSRLSSFAGTYVSRVKRRRRAACVRRAQEFSLRGTRDAGTARHNPYTVSLRFPTRWHNGRKCSAATALCARAC